MIQETFQAQFKRQVPSRSWCKIQKHTTNQNQSLVLFPEEYPIPQSLWVSLGFPFSQLGNPSHDFSIPPTSFNIMFLQEQDNEISTYKP
jgi:hypothetical protein